MSKRYQIDYILKVIDKVTPMVKEVNKSLDKLTKNHEGHTKKQVAAGSKLIDSNKKVTKSYVDRGSKQLSYQQQVEKAYKQHGKDMAAQGKKESQSLNAWKGREDSREKVKSKQMASMYKEQEKYRKKELKRVAIAEKKKQRVLDNYNKKRSASYANLQKSAERYAIADRRAFSPISKGPGGYGLDAPRRAIISRQIREGRLADARLRNQRQMSVASSAGSTMNRAAVVGGAAGGAAGLVSLRNMRTDEQLKIRLLTMFNKDSVPIEKEMKQYAIDTMFTYREAVSLLSDIKLGERNLGFKSNADMVEFTKKLGKVLIAYVPRKADRTEVVTQIGQIAKVKKASTRQDLRVMEKHGLPISSILRAYTGLEFDDLIAKYGAELPSKLILGALEAYSTDPSVARATAAIDASFTKRVDALGDQFFYTTSVFGEVLNETYKLGEGLRFLQKGLEGFESYMTDVDKDGNIITSSSKRKMAAFGYGGAVSTLALGSAVNLMGLLNSKFKLLEGVTNARGLKGLAASKVGHIGKGYLKGAGLFSAGYLLMQDWTELMDSFQDKGTLKTIGENLDVVAAAGGTLLYAATSLSAPMKIILAGVLAIKGVTDGMKYLETSDKFQNSRSQRKLDKVLEKRKELVGKRDWAKRIGWDSKYEEYTKEIQKTIVREQVLKGSMLQSKDLQKREEENKLRMAKPVINLATKNIINGKDIDVQSEVDYIDPSIELNSLLYQ